MTRNHLAAAGLAFFVLLLAVARDARADPPSAKVAERTASAAQAGIDCDKGAKPVPAIKKRPRRVHAVHRTDPLPKACTVTALSLDIPVAARPAPLIPPPLASGESCIGSVAGKAWRDDNCELLRNSAMLWNVGMHDAAIALLCGSPRMRDAMERSGAECPQRPGTSVDAGSTAVRQESRPYASASTGRE